MRIIYKAFLSSLFFAFIFANPISRIIGGEAISVEKFKQFDFVVGIGSIGNLGRLDSQKEIFTAFCTGTLLSPTWVLTAGHCLQENDMYVYAKSNKLFNSLALLNTKLIDNHSDGKISKVRQVFYPYGFELLEVFNRIQSIEDDIALLELEEPIYLEKYPFLAHQVLIDDILSTGKMVDLLGWGKISTYKIASTLMHTSLGLVDIQSCKKLYQKKSLNRAVDVVLNVDNIDAFAKEIICAGGSKEDGSLQGSCFGDSGSGLIYKKNNESYVLGVLSSGTTPCGLLPDMYMNVASYSGFIKDIMTNKGKNHPIKRDVIRKGFIDDLPMGFHMLGVERNIDFTSDIFENVKSIWISNNGVLQKIDIKDGALPQGIVINAKSGFWIQK